MLRPLQIPFSNLKYHLSQDARVKGIGVGGMDVGFDPRRFEDRFDQELSLEQRSIFYLPLRHAEDLEMQKLGLVKTREINEQGYGTDEYALSHLALIERFGRFPHRNVILGRRNTAEEDEYLKDGKAGF